MDFSVPTSIKDDLIRFKSFLREQLIPHVSNWYQERSIPRSFFIAMAKAGWFDFAMKEQKIVKRSSLRAAMIMEQLARISPGVAVAILAHTDLGVTGLWLHGSTELQMRYGPKAVRGETLMCIGNSESAAGSDAAAIKMRADKHERAWVLNGAKAYVTNGYIGDMVIVTAMTDPNAEKSNRISMFLVDLASNGITRTKLNKEVWIPSDLTRVQFTDVRIPEDHAMGDPGRGLQQVLTIFTYSRVPISALTIGAGIGAFELALEHARKRKIFGKRILDHQAKAFEIADFYARIEASRLLVYKACSKMDGGENFRMESSLAKYMAVMTAREVTAWAADLFGAASVIYEHPIHKFPMDAWASSLGEGTQDVQKVIIFRELMRRVESGQSTFL